MEWNKHPICQWVDKKVEEFQFPFTIVMVGSEAFRKENIRVFEENDLLVHWFKRPDKDSVIYFIASPLIEHANMVMSMFRVLDGPEYIRVYQENKPIQALLKSDL